MCVFSVAVFHCCFFISGHRKCETDENYHFNVPHLLKCGHSLCYKCLISGCRRGNVECRPCKSNLVLEKHETLKIPLRDIVPMNYYLQGVLARQNMDWMRYQEYVLQRKMESKKAKEHLCNECSDIVTDRVCQTCALFFCQKCFNKLHMNTISFAKHKLMQIGK